MCGKTNLPSTLSASRKAWMFLCLLSHPKFTRKLGTLVTEGYLARTGWVRSVLTDRIVDADGDPVPWMSRPFIDFIEPRLNKELCVFEYGSGASTLFFAPRVGQIISVEHDKEFAATLTPGLPPNAQTIVRALGSSYWTAIAEMPRKANLVIVDGMDRAECAREAVLYMKGEGVLVLDDSERSDYDIIRDRMALMGFRSLDFWGVTATRTEHRCTTVFYRSNNVLGV